VLGRDLPEPTRNRLLRRVDWRFLLPEPMPARVLVSARGTLPDAVGLVASQASTIPGDRLADLGVTVNPTSAELAALFHSLEPGAACYSEWLFTSAAGVRRRLEDAGFDQVATYWPWPWPGLSPTWFWIPLESDSAPAFVRATRLEARNPLRRAVDVPVRALWSWALRAGCLRPICAVARKPGDTGAPRPGILEWLRECWEGWGMGPAPERLNWLLLTRGPRTISKAVGLVFAEPDPIPRIVVKRPRVPEATVGLEREAAALRAVEALRPRGVSGVPRLLYWGDQAGYPALAETSLTGRPLFSLLSGATYRDLAIRATDWLIQLLPAHAPRQPGRALPLIDDVLGDFKTSFGSVADPVAFRGMKAKLAPLGDLPRVVEQRDFSPWNVHVAPDGQLVVFDWESAELNGLPLVDLIYFLSYLAFFHDDALKSGKTRESYRRSLDPATFTGRVQRECVERYAARLDLDRSLIPSLRLLTWLIHCRSDYGHLAADAAGVPSTSALRKSLFLALWEEELRV